MKTDGNATALIDSLKYDEKGLCPAIIQDAQTGEILMFAFTNKEALTKAFETGSMCFYSRSRKQLWLKGESSGHTQKIQEIKVDCDKDVILVRVLQQGGACHVGYRSCFYHSAKVGDDGKGWEWEVNSTPVFDPNTKY